MGSDSLVIRNVHLAFPDPIDERKVWDVHCRNGKITRILPAHPRVHSFVGSLLDRFLNYASVIDAESRGLLLPALCHSHIHLDKCFLLDRCELKTGTFQEALAVTSGAKTRFPADPADLLARGRRLLSESVICGVTAIRAHVEVDATVGNACLDAALALKAEFADVCDVQIAVFAQDPLFDSPDAVTHGANYVPFAAAATRDGVSAIGSAPYVERTPSDAARNVELVLSLAARHGLFADFHLDYNIDPASCPQVHGLADTLRERSWDTPVALGHCTRLSLLDTSGWATLSSRLGSLPVTLIGLPQSDVYMMRAGGAPRGTINIPVAARAGVRVALATNNVGNAFTPQGTPDPLVLCPLGVALYQDPTPATCRLLLQCVTTASRAAIGFGAHGADILLRTDDAADLVLLHDCASARDAVMCPPFVRTTVRAGRIVAFRRAESWIDSARVYPFDISGSGRGPHGETTSAGIR
ncbi:hypothetical protein K488DRAFT_80320 [Vararia minispora EC-137]|uniref:Uncharacterized protein n=1 Tax=Vararia minispora EC-137 TaxID=1314806 RepID=A0ACB8QBV2_9AGAM|nr:hypothetical protein K488DRAFT_80320 [Vararia minispora EC-137]